MIIGQRAMSYTHDYSASIEVDLLNDLSDTRDLPISSEQMMRKSVLRIKTRSQSDEDDENHETLENYDSILAFMIG